jgi:L-ascorbate 6-phosphate lactonase
VIEPVLSGQALIEEIRATCPGPGVVAVWWLGQSGFLLKSDTATVLVDPYLSEHLTKKYEGTPRPHVRMTLCPVRGSELSGVDLVLASHKHSDHLDPGTVPGLLAASPQATLGLPAPLIEHAVGLGLPRERLVGLVAGETLERPGMSVRAVPSAHEGLDTDEQGRHLYLGFVIELSGLRFYHSGDGVDHDGLAGSIGPAAVDVMFLPINGRDPARGVAGNMTAAEAVALANRVGPRFVVPHHYDMFTFNTAPVASFEEAARGLAPGIQPIVLRCGGRWEVKR